MVRVDVAVVGAGPAGCAAAATVRSAEVSVAMVEGPKPARLYQPGEGLPPGSDRVVRSIFGPTGFVDDEHRRAHLNRAAWGSDALVQSEFVFNPFGSGWHLDRAAFDARLRTGAEAMGAVLLAGSVIASEHSDGRWQLSVDDGSITSTIAASLVCDASGRAGVVARAHGASLVVEDRLTAVAAVCRTKSEADRDSATLVESVEDGWWYTAGQRDGSRVITFFSDGDLLDPAIDRAPEGLARRLARTTHVAELLAAHGYRIEGAVHLLAANSRHLEVPYGEGWLAAGDTAAAFDPISSQGIVSALLGGRRAGETAVALLGRDELSGGDALRAYEAEHVALVAQYRRDLAACYALEQRWPDAPFWARRGPSEG